MRKFPESLSVWMPRNTRQRINRAADREGLGLSSWVRLILFRALSASERRARRHAA
ncbi:hypothetical protein [Candidatus Palauibacter sp.]|uniref:hypothetical protein n=1 Tax=Candidatus Palauibacter sp. TaxID=3101350 RepID=UPI003C7016AE